MASGKPPAALEVRVHDNSDLKAFNAKVTSTYGIPVVVDSTVPKGLVGVLEDCYWCVTLLFPCMHCFGLRRIIRFYPLS